MCPRSVDYHLRGPLVLIVIVIIIAVLVLIVLVLRTFTVRTFFSGGRRRRQRSGGLQFLGRVGPLPHSSATPPVAIGRASDAKVHEGLIHAIDLLLRNLLGTADLCVNIVDSHLDGHEGMDAIRHLGVFVGRRNLTKLSEVHIDANPEGVGVGGFLAVLAKVERVVVTRNPVRELVGGVLRPEMGVFLHLHRGGLNFVEVLTLLASNANRPIDVLGDCFNVLPIAKIAGDSWLR
mmetsp:Transcript_3801/g.8293  ORF Transcript_3801/g.8293 Transcript_3801/m.8293 type:complete len:234 (-) Transcript_3801:614-1315(-)